MDEVTYYIKSTVGLYTDVDIEVSILYDVSKGITFAMGALANLDLGEEGELLALEISLRRIMLDWWDNITSVAELSFDLTGAVELYIAQRRILN